MSRPTEVVAKALAAEAGWKDWDKANVEVRRAYLKLAAVAINALFEHEPFGGATISQLVVLDHLEDDREGP